MPCVEDREAFLQKPNVAVLSTVDSAGRPHAAPVWYLYEDGVFVISTGIGSQKHKNVLANPNVCLTIDKRDLPYYAVMVHGRAEIGPQFTPEERLRLAVRYLGDRLGRAYVERGGDNGISVRLRPERVLDYHGRAARTR